MSHIHSRHGLGQSAKVGTGKAGVGLSSSLTTGDKSLFRLAQPAAEYTCQVVVKHFSIGPSLLVCCFKVRFSFLAWQPGVCTCVHLEPERAGGAGPPCRLCTAWSGASVLRGRPPSEEAPSQAIGEESHYFCYNKSHHVMYTRDRKEKRTKEFSPSKCLLVQLRNHKMSIQSSQTRFPGPAPTQRAMP